MPRKKRQAKSQTVKDWKPLALYQHQEDAVAAYRNGVRRMFLAWHRRAGKDVFSLDFARERMYERIGTYWHLFPFHVQAKRAIWKGIDARTGERFIDRAFPKSMRESENETEMSITMDCGSIWQMLGSDNYDRMVGSNPCGVIFSEWALCDPAAWDYIRPILVENKGWAVFITTFRGRNHAYRMFENIKDADGWYADLRTINDTYRRDASPIVSEEDVQKEIEEGMDEALVQQEFYCNPNAATSGAIFNAQYGRLLELDPQQYERSSKLIRIAWGMDGEGIAAVALQDNHIVGTHCFLEQNLIDAVQHVAKRYPHTSIIHHAINPDMGLFGSVDGIGVVASQINQDEHMINGHAAAMLNRCNATSAARERLADFAMNYAPYRERLDDSDLTDGALAKALAVAHSAQPMYKSTSGRPLNYSRYDRGVI
jgi:hypothetical protein